jgi:hypothetical protein
MQWWSYGLIGLGGYLFFILISLPAQHVLGWATPDSDSSRPPFTYGSIKGSLWRGKMETLEIQGVPVDKLNWSFAPSQLFFGRIGFDIQINHTGQELEGNIAIGMNDQYVLKDVNGQISANVIPPLINLSQIGLDGNLSLDLQYLSLEAQKITSAEGQIQWLSSALKSPIALKLGDLQADLLTDENGQVKAKIKDMGGSTSVDGELSLTTDGNFQVNGQIKPGTDSDPRLGSALSAISKRQADGSYQINYSARL